MNYGKFITAVINFLIMALVIFVLMKAVNKASATFAAQKEEEEAVTMKTCPFCKSEISVDASRCPHCTSALDVEIH